MAKEIPVLFHQNSILDTLIAQLWVLVYPKAEKAAVVDELECNASQGALVRS